jgi:hypothetical protein
MNRVPGPISRISSSKEETAVDRARLIHERVPVAHEPRKTPLERKLQPRVHPGRRPGIDGVRKESRGAEEHVGVGVISNLPPPVHGVEEREASERSREPYFQSMLSFRRHFGASVFEGGNLLGLFGRREQEVLHLRRLEQAIVRAAERGPKPGNVVGDAEPRAHRGLAHEKRRPVEANAGVEGHAVAERHCILEIERALVANHVLVEPERIVGSELHRLLTDSLALAGGEEGKALPSADSLEVGPGLQKVLPGKPRHAHHHSLPNVPTVLFRRDRRVPLAGEELGPERVPIGGDVRHRSLRPASLPDERLVVVPELLSLPLSGELLFEGVGDAEAASARRQVEDQGIARRGAPVDP